MKRLGKYNEIQSEIENSDFSDKTRDFRMCYYALKGETDVMYEIIQKALEVNEVTLADLRNWPVFDDYRDDERFIGIMLDEKDEGEESIFYTPGKLKMDLYFSCFIN